MTLTQKALILPSREHSALYVACDTRQKALILPSRDPRLSKSFNDCTSLILTIYLDKRSP